MHFIVDIQPIAVIGIHFKVGLDGVSRNMEPEVTSQVLAVGETLETRQTNQTFGFVIVKLFFRQRKPFLSMIMPGNGRIYVGRGVVFTGEALFQIFGLLVFGIAITRFTVSRTIIAA